MPPSESEKDPDLFRGPNCSIGKIALRMAEHAGREIDIYRSASVRDSHCFSMKGMKTGDVPQQYRESQIQNVLSKTMIGTYDRLFDDAHQAIVVELDNQRLLGGAALLENSSHAESDARGTKYIYEPSVAMLSFGVHDLEEKEKLNCHVLEKIAAETIAYAHKLSRTLQPLGSTRNSPDFTPTILLHPLQHLKPTIGANGINSKLGTLCARLGIAQFIGTTKSSEFLEALVKVEQALEDMETHQGKHPITEALVATNVQRSIEQCRLSGDQPSYKQAEKITSALNTILTALRIGVSKAGDQFYPNKVENDYVNITFPSFMESQDTGTITVEAEQGSYGAGSITFKTNDPTDKNPQVIFNLHNYEGIASEGAGALLRAIMGTKLLPGKKPPKAVWYRKQVQSMA